MERFLYRDYRLLVKALDKKMASTIITKTDLESFRKNIDKSPSRLALRNAIIKNGLMSVSMSYTSLSSMRHSFSEEISTGKITDQKISGRCWLFAGLNIFRQKIINELNLKTFELSQNYPMFWDKLEKANFFFENIIRTAKEDKYSRLIMWLLTDPVQDGGQWDMFVNLIKKYGVVPKDVMPETFNSEDTRKMDWALTLKLRSCAQELRVLAEKSPGKARAKKSKLMKEVYSMLVHFLGEPPSKFDFEYRDKDKNFFQDIQISPQQFYSKYVKINLDDYVSLINVPIKERPYENTYTVNYLGNLVEGKQIHYLNVDMNTLKKAALTQIKKGMPVWFGSEVEKMLDRKSGILDSNLYLLEEALGAKIKLEKGKRVQYGESKMSHAMLISGVNLVNGRPNRWKVENSWGKDDGNEGFYVMSDQWFDDYVYQVVVNKKFLSPALRKLFKKTPMILPPWDPMGALALMH